MLRASVDPGECRLAADDAAALVVRDGPPGQASGSGSARPCAGLPGRLPAAPASTWRRTAGLAALPVARAPEPRLIFVFVHGDHSAAAEKAGASLARPGTDLAAARSGCGSSAAGPPSASATAARTAETCGHRDRAQSSQSQPVPGDHRTAVVPNVRLSRPVVTSALRYRTAGGVALCSPLISDVLSCDFSTRAGVSISGSPDLREWPMTCGNASWGDPRGSAGISGISGDRGSRSGDPEIRRSPEIVSDDLRSAFSQVKTAFRRSGDRTGVIHDRRSTQKTARFSESISLCRTRRPRKRPFCPDSSRPSSMLDGSFPVRVMGKVPSHGSGPPG